MSQSNQGTVSVRFSIGFGNNIFQYSFARLLAEYHGLNFNHPELPGFRIPAQSSQVNNSLKTIHVRQEGYKTGAFDKYFLEKTPNTNFDVSGFFEDYTIYQDKLDVIRSWFPVVEKRKDNDLIIHLRLQNRLVQLNHYMNFISGKAYANVLNNFDFDRLHIVTDAEKWDYYHKDDVEKIRKDILDGPNPGADWIPVNDSIEYMAELIDSFSKFDPIVHCTNSPTIKGSGGLRDDFMNSFDLIRSFNQVVIYNSTFSWWAAVLGAAKNVGVFSLWKPGRDDKNPNLGSTSYPGWFSWGDGSDLIRHRKSKDPYYQKSWEKRLRRNHWRNRYFILRRKLRALFSGLFGKFRRAFKGV